MSTKAQPHNRSQKTPFFGYFYSYCIARDMSEQEALDELSHYSGVEPNTLRNCFSNQEALNNLTISTLMSISKLFNEILTPFIVKDIDDEQLLPVSFNMESFQSNDIKQKWFKWSLRDDKRLSKQPCKARRSM